ncbi:molecular chaperone DnaJ [Ameyamaea chiangmaiensis NBRC 103196]|uniref:J domain-containing protein n=1 Tax=Ameyamaea chiangmaiensis TaxID=442969 RepID=A0A850PII2_9PROT|nr:DnaJ C-terminal domain-containing protein [Ameyamaea chiangmaiensis]MBS4074320.1 J domain-containing protein [Ameyamaea chiangmaiensis]NVN41051.1 J domain-containing protein [Ameyamaea chiangmaiensis]GBQ71631.1 molecular chaperone DnaJ [Ameyamaea chiangmaiensis NBRC 103196]
MSEDPYKTLGLDKSASQDDIRKAYRSLAKKYHPDLNPGDAAAEERFKAIGAANALLSDADQRARFDRGEIDASGQERAYRPHPGYRDFGEGAQGARYAGAGGGFGEEDLEGIFGGMFGGGFGRRQQGPRRGADQNYTLQISLLDAINGATSRVSLPDGGRLDVRIPPGTDDGSILRLRGKGGPGVQGGPDGDALITVSVAADAIYTRDGRDVRMTLPVDLRTAVLGGPITVPTPAGNVTMNVPAHSDSGSVLRLRGRGVKAHGHHEVGNLYVTLRVTIGTPDDALETFLRGWHAPDPAPAERKADAS